MDGPAEQETGAEEAPARVHRLHPNHAWLLRIRFAAAALLLLLVAFTIDAGPLRDWPEAPAEGVLPLGLAVLLAILLVYWPGRRYRAWSWREEEDELHIGWGVWTRVRTAVPFARVQHIDVAAGPLQRPLGLATLILHTAGTRGASVVLPGLAPAEAERLRDRIRAKIRQDLL
jgi:uncharacterized protein